MPILRIHISRAVAVAKLLVLVAVFLPALRGQTSAPAPAKAGASSAPTSMDFAIETEMLTYRAVESNSEAVACDIAGYLAGVPAKFVSTPLSTTAHVSPANSVCDVEVRGRKTIVLLPFDNQELANFLIWRSDMAAMERLHRKAELVCKNTSRSGSAAAPGAAAPASLMGAVLSMSPAAGPIGIAQSVLASLAHETSIAPVVGTVHDQAFLDGVGRQLRSLGITVIMPTAYPPFSLAPLDVAASPFLASLERILDVQDRCIETLAISEAADKEAKNAAPAPSGAANTGANGKTGQNAAPTESEATRRINEMLAEITSYLNVLSQAAPQPAASGGQPQSGAAGQQATGSTPQSTGSAPQSTGSTAQSTGSAPQASGARPAGAQTAAPAAAVPITGSHLNAVLSADGLAQRLGVEPSTGAMQVGVDQYILLIQPLESGGAVVRHSNIFGSSVSYTGGAVGTYALLTIGGDLECSGNVFEYLGEFKNSDFDKKLQGYKFDPSKQIVFLRGGCRSGRPSPR